MVRVRSNYRSHNERAEDNSGVANEGRHTTIIPDESVIPQDIDN